MVLVTASFSVSALVGGWTLRRRLAYLSSADPPSADSDSRLGFGQVLSVALPALVANLALFGLLQADIWILGAFRGEKEVAIYGSASRLAMAIMVAIQVLYAVLPPLIVEKHTKNEKETLERLLRGAATASSILMLPLFLAFVLVPGEILKLVYGPYYESGRWILSILSVGIFFNVLTGIRGYVLLITGSERVQLTISVLGGLSNIALCTLGAIYWGIYGVALAAMTMMVLQCLAELVFVRLRRGVWTHFSFGMVRETKLLLDTLKSRRINR